MELELCDFELSVMLKEVGFNWKCFNRYSDKPKGVGRTINNLELVLDLSMAKEEYLVDANKYNHVFWNISAPTLELAKMWFREIHGINIVIQKVVGNKGTAFETVTYTHEGSPWRTKETYNQALSAGLKEECCKLIK